MAVAEYESARRSPAIDLGPTGKGAVVIGASRGIGKAIAGALTREGCDAIAVARSGELLHELAATAGRDSTGASCPASPICASPTASPAPSPRRNRPSGAWIFW
jgi:NAD(P)-dependent dehydrogenase (short-subunit alcohol dehydrogenase family)